MSEAEVPNPATTTRDDLNAAAQEAGVENPEELATKADVADAIAEQVGGDGTDQPANAGESPSERRARLTRELEEAQADVDAENAQRLAQAAPEELCPTCGQLPPPADPPAGAREIWCPDCGQKLANLPAGH